MELRCGDPLSQTLLLDGLLQLFVSISLLTYPGCLPGLFSSAAKVSRFDQFAIRVFAGTNFGLSMINFSSLGLPDEDAASFLRFGIEENPNFPIFRRISYVRLQGGRI